MLVSAHSTCMCSNQGSWSLWTGEMWPMFSSLAITQTYFPQHRMYCITGGASDAIHPVLRDVGLGDSE